MEQTRHQLTALIAELPTYEQYNALPLENLAKEYVVGGLPPDILAHAFRKVYGLIYETVNRFYGVTSDDLASIALEKLDYCLQTYKEEENVRFTTYFVTVLNCALRAHTQSLNTHKRKAVFNSTSYEELMESGFDIQQEFACEILDLDSSLTDKERIYCKLLSMDFSNAEIAKMMNVSVMTLSNMRKTLRTKLAP